MSEDNGSGVDKPRIEAAVREILLAIGEDPDRDGFCAGFAHAAHRHAHMLGLNHNDRTARV